MPQATNDPASRLNESIQHIVPRFAFESPLFIVGRSHYADIPHEDGTDEDIYDGLIYSSHGYARVARHMPTGTICLIPSKESINLQGRRDKQGRIIPTQQGLERSYIIAAYRTGGKDADVYMVAPKMRRALRRFWEDLGERSEKHFTQYGAQVNIRSGGRLRSKMTGIAEVHTNGRLYYTIRNEGGEYVVRFVAPTRRKDGSFLAPSLSSNSLSEHFSGVAKVVARAKSYEDARHDMAMHWQRISAKLWDERDIYEGEGYTVQIKRVLAGIFNNLVDKSGQVAAATIGTGLVVGTIVNPAYGAVGGILAAMIHTAIHQFFDEGYKVSAEAFIRARSARRRFDLDAYPPYGDVSDHFKVQTAENIGKKCAKIDLTRFPANEFEFLTSEQSRMLLDHENARDGFYPSSLRNYLLTAHQRGFSSSCMLPDMRTRLDLFQSGLVRFMHEKKDGTIVIYGRYRADICTDEKVRMPENKQAKFGEEIIKLEYDRRRPGDVLYHAFKRSSQQVTIESMMKDIEQNLLFVDQPNVPDHIRDKSLRSIREAFTLREQPVRSAYKFMTGQPATLPDIRAIIT